MFQDMAAIDNVERFVRILNVRKIHSHHRSGFIQIGSQQLEFRYTPESGFKSILRRHLKHVLSGSIEQIGLVFKEEDGQSLTFQRPANRAACILSLIHISEPTRLLSI